MSGAGTRRRIFDGIARIGFLSDGRRTIRSGSGSGDCRHFQTGETKEKFDDAPNGRHLNAAGVERHVGVVVANFAQRFPRRRLQPVMASAIAKDLRWSRFVVFEYVDGTADGWIVLRFRFKFPRSI